MDNAAGTMNSDYVEDLQLIRSIREDDSFWDCIFDAKLDFLNNGTDPRLHSCVRPEIAESWIRSYNSGLKADDANLGEHITEEDLERSLSDHAEIVQTARSLIRNIESLNLQNDYIFELLDASGIALVQVGNLEQHQFVGPNYRCDEANVGTNAHSLCMRHKKPFVVVGPEHYCFGLQGLIACAAPVIDQFDTGVAAITLTQSIPEGPLSSSDEKILVHAMSLASSIAIALSDQLRLNQYDAKLAETEQKYSEASLEAQRFESISRTVINTVKDGILICNTEGFITLATPEAAHLFKVPPEDLLGTDARSLVGDGRSFREIVEQGGSTTAIIGDELHDTKISQISGSENDLEGYIISLKETKRATLGASRGKVGDAAEIQFKDILGESEQITKAKTLASRFARSSENILLVGESGTGKELFAQAIHNQACPNGPFMSINCAAIPPRLIESELFGYESGSFTGAEKGGKPGKIELAEGGTLFLDEIGDMPLELQATLLRVLENKRVIRVGGKSYKQIDFRLIAATNQNLPLLVSEHRFREDLLYRISVLTVNLPPLRERGNDALYFARFFLNECQVRTGNGKVALSDDAEHFVRTYSWPGNVRQLKHAIYSAYYTCENGIITIDDFPLYIAQNGSYHAPADKALNPPPTPDAASSPESSSSVKVHDSHPSAPSVPASAGQSTTLPTLSLGELERIAIDEAIKQAGGNIAAAAGILNISKATLYRKLKDS
ncbi:sigma-54-dependent Fis family transcriptional regulator [Raoultibacter phocaeensis]|uniref:sigma-54-dependent Fis family transcriptional regulator n=1 Tax=Raoultibacter phocaeensis TaxID=2479841 RepID=UPI001119B6C4|nr:sigma 54-interacting transcriptional regulator [Raoultibacter phocaeensis]